MCVFEWHIVKWSFQVFFRVIHESPASGSLVKFRRNVGPCPPPPNPTESEFQGLGVESPFQQGLRWV